MILAGIDIGTNTLRLLIADTGPESFHEIYSDRRITRLGQDLDRTGIVSENARARSIAALADFARSIKQYQVDHTAAVGTSALRNASNSIQFIEEAFRVTGLGIRVITGEEEAALTLLGVTRSLQNLRKKTEKLDLNSVLIIDIGGGSTEIIMIRPAAKSTETSLPLGAVYLTERFIKHDPPLPEELERIRQSIRNELDRCADCYGKTHNTILVGTAGTITTLAAMDLQLAVYDPTRINGAILTKESIDSMVLKLTLSTDKERRCLKGLERGREDIITAGAIVAQEIMDKFGFGKMIVSDWGLREGIILDLYDRIISGQISERSRNGGSSG